MYAEHGARLVTLTGPAGTGKTRLALAVAAALSKEAPDGVTVVDLSAFGDWRLVVSAIARELPAQELGSRSGIESLQEALAEQRALLVLDNFEHVLGAAPQVAELLAACLYLRVLVTSREPLRIRWEQILPIGPLGLPNAGLMDLEAIAQAPAVALFALRAVAVQPNFALTPENCGAVAEICTRLDGLPLAIELAAARSNVLPPEAMVARLDRRLDLLKGDARDYPSRHRALRAAIDWSYALLDTYEQAAFRRLGVFAGGCTLEAAAAVGDPAEGGEAANSAPNILDLIAALSDKSLLHRDERVRGEPRFRMLETVREYALEQLAAGGEVDLTARRHCAYYLELAQRAAPELKGAQQGVWAERLEQEHDNLRVSLRWLAGHGEVDAALRLASALAPFWMLSGSVDEGRIWLSQLLSLPEAASTPARAIALLAAVDLAGLQGDDATVWELQRETLQIEQAQAVDQHTDGSLAAQSQKEPATNAGQADGLTQREVEVLQLIARGMTNKEIARALFLSVPTVQTHLANIYRKIDVHGRAAATAYALTHGLDVLA
jgi:predicted ATPase/DNA-binding CsgD family transcriptional regulator